MEAYFLSADQADGSILCLAPLTSRQVAMADIDLDDQAGVFLFQQYGSDDDTRIKIIARVLSEDAALMLQSAFRLT